MNGRFPDVSLGLLLYLVAALALTFPLAAHWGDATISHWDVDITHSLWIQWWFGRAIESPDHHLFRTALLHHPYGVDLQFADVNFAIQLPTWVLGKHIGATAAYNLMVLLSFLASAGLFWLWGWRISRNEIAGWIAGLFFAASPYWLACLANAWVYLVHIWVLPLTLLAVRRMLRSLRVRDAVLAGFAYGLSFHVTPYYLVYVGVLSLLLAPWWARGVMRGLSGARAGVLAAAAALAFLLLVAPRAVPMLGALSGDFVVHHDAMNTALRARPSEFLLPFRAAVESRLPDVGYLVVFLSWTMLAGVATGFVRTSDRRRFMPWLVAAGAMVVLSLGPWLLIGGEGDTRIPLPGWLVNRLPVFRFLTNHWRWILPALFSLATVFALSLGEGFRALRSRGLGATGPAAAIVSLLALELAFLYPIPARKPLWHTAPDPIAEVIRGREDVRAVLDFGSRRKLNQMTHGKPIVGGWLPRIRRQTFRSSREIEQVVLTSSDREEVRSLLDRLGVDAVIVAPDRATVLEPHPEWPGRFIETEVLAPGEVPR